MVLNATFNNISVMSWRSVLLVDEAGMEEAGVPGENHFKESISQNLLANSCIEYTFCPSINMVIVILTIYVIIILI